MRIRNEELYSIRDAMRYLNRLIDKLERREVDQIVLMRKNQMVAVIRPVDPAERSRLPRERKAKDGEA